MTSDKRQMNFDEKLARPISPDTGINEPLVWFQSLCLFRQLGAGDKPENWIRRFTFRTGLNILWAEPEAPEMSEGLYGDGFAGHATGKTLFCRILRYLLGESNYGTAELQEHVRDTFQELWAVAAVRLSGQSWLVGRPLSGSTAEFAIPDGEVAGILAAIPTFGGYSQFLDALERECGAPLAEMYPNEGWRNLLPWVARDQEARFSNLIAWRGSSSEADNPRTSAAAQHLILRAALGLLNPEELRIRQSMATDEKSLQTWSAELLLNQRVAERELTHAARSLEAVPSFHADLTDLKAAQEHLRKHIEIRKEGLPILRAQPDSQEVQEARQALQTLLLKTTEVTSRLRDLRAEIPQLEEQASKSLLLIERVKKKGLRDPKRASEDFCPNSYLMAVSRECIPAPPEDVRASMVTVEELEQQAREFQRLIQSRTDERARLESEGDQLTGKVKSGQEALAEAMRKFPNPAIAIAREITLLEQAASDLADAIESAGEEARLRADMANAQARTSKHKEGLEYQRVLAGRALQPFSGVFGDIVRALLGTSISAFADLGERGIHLHVKRTRELGGAAVESVKTIAFDLAAVLHAVEGHCTHPRLLIHDGPREADMARVIYERFFLYARRMEDRFPADQSSFQYILTTTTPPPVGMQEGSKWLLGEKLSGKVKEGRLLKEDF